MPNIYTLPHNEAQKIAAGEVVERPINIVKELIENALDAGATKIVVHLKNGGKDLIRIIDNGVGMDDIDAQNCFGRHATSKIRSFDDLQYISTFGFRGEALASIASISHVTLATKQSNMETGIKVTATNGVVSAPEQITLATGTDITITDLFYNVPVRKKFLKNADTEWRHIIQFMHSLCVSNITLDITVIHDGSTVLHCPPAPTITTRFAQLWKIYTSIPLYGERITPAIQCSGALVPATVNRYDRNGIHLIVNNRIINNYKLSNAIVKGYTNTLPQGKYPYAVIMITMDTNLVDINIHPRKEEVLFVHPRIIEQLIEDTVRNTLEQSTSKKILDSSKTATKNSPNTTLLPTNNQENTLSNTSIPHSWTTDRIPLQSFTPKPTDILLARETKEHHNIPIQHTQKNHTVTHLTTDDTTIEAQPKLPHIQDELNIVGYYKKTYIMLEHSDGLLLIDAHAAHERVLYEKFTNKFADIHPIKLLFPHTITLPVTEIKLLIEHQDILTTNNIIIEQLSDTEMIITATAEHLKEVSMQDLIKEIVGWLHEYESLTNKELFDRVNEKLHAQMACKAAIKAGDTLSNIQMHTLVMDLYNTSNRFCCPHGRPTSFLLPLYDIEKKFKRRT